LKARPVLRIRYGCIQLFRVSDFSFLNAHDGQRVYVGASESRKDGQASGY